MNDRVRVDSAPRDVVHARSELEVLTYLGMRRVLRAKDRTAVLSLARESNARHARALDAWRAGSDLAPMRVERFDILESARSKGSGAVIALPHCGPYFRASLALADRDVLLSVLAEHRTFDEESSEIERLGAAYRGSIDRPARELVEIIDASQATAAWQTIVSLRRGRAALAYFDNNFGLDARAGTRTSAVFEVCGVPVVGRLGAALLAGTAGVPLVPAIARFGEANELDRDSNDLDRDESLVLRPPLFRESGEALDAFAMRATSSLFGLLGREIERDPTAWDLWFGLIGRTARPQLTLVEREPEMLEVLAMRVRLASDVIEELDSPYGRLIANLERGTTIIRNDTYAAIEEIVAEGASIEKLAFDLGATLGDDDLALETIKSLVDSGFLVSA